MAGVYPLRVTKLVLRKIAVSPCLPFPVSGWRLCSLRLAVAKIASFHFTLILINCSL